MMYFTRINLSDINLLVKEAFNINKDLHDNGMYSWYTLVFFRPNTDLQNLL
jgi:DUF971 family protein